MDGPKIRPLKDSVHRDDGDTPHVIEVAVNGSATWRLEDYADEKSASDALWGMIRAFQAGRYVESLRIREQTELGKLDALTHYAKHDDQPF